MGGILHPMEIVKRLLCRENAAAACLLSALLGCGIGNPGPAFNVVVIVLDTTRADHLGLYGASRAITPRLDELAAESAVFDLAIAQASVTPVSCASLLTGLWPYRHGLRVLHGTSKNRLPPAAVTLAEVWKQAGGRSAAFVSAFPASGAFGLAQGFDVFDAEFGIENAPHISKRGVVTTGMSQRRADVTTDAALDWLERAERDRAFLLWLHYFDPHDTYLTPPREFVARFPPASSSGADALRALYAAEIAFVDSQIGRVIDALRSDGLWDSTVVVVTADHGEGLDSRALDAAGSRPRRGPARAVAGAFHRRDAQRARSRRRRALALARDGRRESDGRAAQRPNGGTPNRLLRFRGHR
jgi:arylsulfatase A-like enzyme